jgi:hypothetical protein
MSRSGYDDYCDGWDLVRWRGAVKSALRGKRGQAFLRELVAALDAIESHELISSELEQNGQVCALGSVGVRRGLDMAGIDPYDRREVARAFGIAEAMAAEVMHENDEARRVKTPRQRWEHMRSWAIAHLRARREAEGQG